MEVVYSQTYASALLSGQGLTVQYVRIHSIICDYGIVEWQIQKRGLRYIFFHKQGSPNAAVYEMRTCPACRSYH